MPNPTFRRWTADAIAKLKNWSISIRYLCKSAPTRGVAKSARESCDASAAAHRQGNEQVALETDLPDDQENTHP